MNSGERDLHATCEQGDTRLCLALLLRGVNVNAKDSNQASVLTISVKCNKVEIVNILLQMRDTTHCNVYGFDNQGFSAFHWAVILGYVDIVSLMTYIDMSLLTRPDQSGRSPFYLCSMLRPNPQVSYCMHCLIYLFDRLYDLYLTCSK
jgi:ankyrin repeat protein